MKNSGLIIGLGIGLLIGAAIGLYIASDDEQKAAFIDDIKNKAEEAKKSIGKVVKQGLEELDKSLENISQAAQENVSTIESGLKSETA